MLVGEQSPAPRVVAGLRKLRPELTPGPVPTPVDPDFRISGWCQTSSYLQIANQLDFKAIDYKFIAPDLVSKLGSS